MKSSQRPALVKATPVRLSDLGYSEKWLQTQVANDPGILGLGDLRVIGAEKRQDFGRRIDLVLRDHAGQRRYIVELMRGEADDSHVMRCLAYYTEEKTRAPKIDYCAVLVAEGFPQPLLRVIQELEKNVPCIAIQLQGLRVAGHLVLSFVNRLDARTLMDQDESVDPTGSNAGEGKANFSQEIEDVVRKLFGLVRESSPASLQLNHKKRYVGLANSGVPCNFIVFWPNRHFLWMGVKGIAPKDWIRSLQAQKMEAEFSRRRLWVKLTAGDVRAHHPILRRLIRSAVATHFPKP